MPKKVERIAYSVPEFAELIGISTRKAWELVYSGAIRHLKIGRRVLIRKCDIEEFINTHMEIRN